MNVGAVVERFVFTPLEIKSTLSSVVERSVHIGKVVGPIPTGCTAGFLTGQVEEVTGSIPVLPTFLFIN